VKITNLAQQKEDFEAAKKQTLLDTQRCVMCGMCSAHCPTYELSRDENESPRGRITLIQSLLLDRIQASPSIEKHLDNCLMCRSCETICPSKVAYGDILNFGRNYIVSEKIDGQKQGQTRNFGLSFIIQNSKIKRLAFLIKLYQRSGLQFFVRKTRVLEHFRIARIERLIPSAARIKDKRSIASDTSEKKLKKISLFTGCLAQIFDQQTLEASKNILIHCGYSVTTPENQTCCGAMHEHNGDSNTAAYCAKTNIDAFSEAPENKVIFSATGCGASLSDYQKKHPDFSNTEPFHRNLSDILSFLHTEQSLDNKQFDALDKKVLIHRPCLSRNILKITHQTEALLKNIPKLNIKVVDTSANCCGAAGSHMISNPEHAAAIREKLLNDILIENPDILVSDNLGCVLHIQEGLRTKGLDIEVVHPVVLLERQLQS